MRWLRWGAIVALTAGLGAGCSDGEAAGEGGAAGGGGGGSTIVCADAKPPAKAQCLQDSDCPPPDDPDCADVVCEKCATFTCQIVPKRVGLSCSRGSGKCASPGGNCSAQGTCQGVQPRCPSPQTNCLESACDPETGACVEKPANEGASCYSGKCFQGETCQSGVCQGGENGCLDTPCAKASCAPGGGCQYERIIPAPSCDDGDACTEGDVCVIDDSYQRAHCAGAAKALDCSGLEEGCVVGSCDPKTGACVKRPAPRGALCGEGCDGGACSGLGVCGPREHAPLSPLFHASFGGPLEGWELSGGWALAHGNAPGALHDATVGDGEDGYLSTPIDQNGKPEATSPSIPIPQGTSSVQISFFEWRAQGSSPGPGPGPYYYQQPIQLEVNTGTSWVAQPVAATQSEQGWVERRVESVAVKGPSIRLRFTAPPSYYYGQSKPIVALDEIVIGTPLLCGG